MEVLYEDNHIIIVNKTCREIVQGDKTGDTTLGEQIAAYIKEKYAKPGNVFVGVAHRLDRPTSGVVVFAKTSKALSRLCDMFAHHDVKKLYWAVVKNAPKEEEKTLVNYLKRNEKQNKSFVVGKGVKDAKEAILTYRTIAKSDNYTLLEVDLATMKNNLGSFPKKQ